MSNLTNNEAKVLDAMLGARPSRETKISALLIRANFLRKALAQVEQDLFDLDYEKYHYITGVIRRRSEESK